MTGRARLMAAAHRATRRACRLGQLPLPTTLSCDDCGRRAVVYDHRDYAQPLLVAPVCHGCNIKRGPGLPFRDAAIPPHGESLNLYRRSEAVA